AAVCDCEPGEPVCGVDGITYQSRCALDCRGVELAHPGECRPQCGARPACQETCEWGYVTDPQGCPTCECATGPRTMCSDTRACAPGEWCNPSACAPSCLACADCRPACEPELCACSGVWDPVCDDAGWTWANACEAECAGISNARRGNCNGMC